MNQLYFAWMSIPGDVITLDIKQLLNELNLVNSGSNAKGRQDYEGYLDDLGFERLKLIKNIHLYKGNNRII